MDVSLKDLVVEVNGAGSPPRLLTETQSVEGGRREERGREGGEREERERERREGGRERGRREMKNGEGNGREVM